MTNISVVKIKADRFIIIDKDTGEVLDDAQGYGYKSVKKAYAAWAYKKRDRSKDSEREAKRRHIRQWLKDHKEFTSELEMYAFDITEGSGDPDEKVDTKLVRKILKKHLLEIDFTPNELLKVWRGKF